MIVSLTLSVTLAYALYFLFKRSRRVSIAHIRGPPFSSWWHGNLYDLVRVQTAEADFKWRAMYGDVIRLHAPLGEDRLLVSDPKAIQYIFHTAPYRFPKPPSRRSISRTLFGPGLTNVDGDDHKRARKIMLPGFMGSEAKSSLPIFFGCAEKMAEQWQDMIASDPAQSAVIDIPNWTSRATLDAIGQAAFDYQFGALDDAQNALAKAYTNFFFKVFGIPNKAAVLVFSVLDNLPVRLTDFFFTHFPPKRLLSALATTRLANSVSKDLVEEKSSALLGCKGRRDIMSLLVKANRTEDPKAKLSEKELLAQMNIIILGGHETTSNTLSFVLIEMCKNPDMQKRVRQEIHSKGNTRDFTAADFGSMPYLTAFIKETLRFHPVVYNLWRIAGGDDVIPLMYPITTETGEVLTELPVPKGVHITTSIAAYNRNTDIFGEDADIFNPDRWLRESEVQRKNKVPLGVYANLFSFSGGARSCIGWQFAVLALHAFMVELIGQFEFEFADVTPESIRREACNIMTPTLRDDVAKGAQLPLRVRPATRGQEM
ncbi:cytochrome P450 [Hymenopellis radicata]|nr:cytochrome P450 [Hymenopellis radicata]